LPLEELFRFSSRKGKNTRKELLTELEKIFEQSGGNLTEKSLKTPGEDDPLTSALQDIQNN